jgi:PAS domain S-box-containing protein
MTTGGLSNGRHRAIHSLHKERAVDELSLFRYLAYNAAQGIAVTDNEMRLVYVNPAFEALYGVDHRELYGSNPLDFGLTPSERESLSQAIQGGYQERGAWSGEMELQRPDGSRAVVLVSASRLLNDDAEVIGRVAMLTDISELKDVEAKLRSVNEELDAYAHTVSHDLRNPLSAVVLANKLIKDACNEDIETLRAELDESTDTIERNIHKACSLINDLLSLAESGQKPEEVTDVDVTAVVARVLDEHANDIENLKVKVIRDRRFGKLRASETHVYQLFSNLVSNAIKHNDSPKPAITLRHLADTADGRHRFLVRDNSSGIPEDEVGKIFKPFYSRPSSGSTGIGLAIVKKIVDVYGGTLRFYNDGGACFEFAVRDAENSNGSGAEGQTAS